MWSRFDGKPYSLEQVAARIASCDFRKWRHKDGSLGPAPSKIVLHNTSDPDLKLWRSWSPAKRQQYILNVQPFYAAKGWLGGPHFFVTPQTDDAVFGFNDLMAAGTHDSCVNDVSIGIEMIGEYETESFSSGDGALVRDNAVFLIASLCKATGIDPRTLLFHKECKHDNHPCPGKGVLKGEVIARVLALYPRPEVPEIGKPITPAEEPWANLDWPISSRGSYRMAWIQDTLNRLNGGRVQITVDGLKGPMTEMAVRHFQHDQNIAIDGDVGEETMAALKRALAAAGAH